MGEISQTRVRLQNSTWGEDALDDPLPPLNPFGLQANHVPQWVIQNGKWVDVLALENQEWRHRDFGWS